MSILAPKEVVLFGPVGGVVPILVLMFEIGGLDLNEPNRVSNKAKGPTSAAFMSEKKKMRRRGSWRGEGFG